MKRQLEELTRSRIERVDVDIRLVGLERAIPNGGKVD